MVTWWLWFVLGGMGGGMGPPFGFFISLLVIWLVLELASESAAKNGGKIFRGGFFIWKNWHAVLHLYVHLSSVKHFLYVEDHFLWKKTFFFLLLEKTFKQFSRYVNFKGLCPTKLDGWNFVVLVNSGINKQFIMNKKNTVTQI